MSVRRRWTMIEVTRSQKHAVVGYIGEQQVGEQLFDTAQAANKFSEDYNEGKADFPQEECA